MTLIDPCPDTVITLLESPFTDATYTLRDPEMSQTWLIHEMAVKESPAQCGPYELEIYHEDGTPIDTTLFDDVRVLDPKKPNEFLTLYSEDVTKDGEYPFKYRLRLRDYPENVVESPVPFTITVIDPCDNPVILHAPELVDQEYTITDDALPYQIPEFIPEPSWCDVTYSYTIVDPKGADAVDFDTDPDSRTFTFSNLEDLTLAGANFTEY